MRPDAARAVEENTSELLLAMGRAGGGGERNDGGVQWTIGGSSPMGHRVHRRLGFRDVCETGVYEWSAH
jgi:hypothetical protein